MAKFGAFYNFLQGVKSGNLQTMARKAKFRFVVLPDRVDIIPASTNRRRKHPVKYLKRVFETHDRNGSWRPSDYHHITVNASYALALIDLYRQQGNGKRQS